MTTTTYRVAGMTCGHCVTAVTNEVGRVTGVTDVHVDLDAGTATVTTDRPVDVAAVAAAVEAAGYRLVS